MVADRLDQCLRLGEIHHAVAEGVLDASRVHGELGEIAAGLKPGRESDDEITVADLTGANIAGANMEGADVDSAKLVDLKGTDSAKGMDKLKNADKAIRN